MFVTITVLLLIDGRLVEEVSSSFKISIPLPFLAEVGIIFMDCGEEKGRGGRRSWGEFSGIRSVLLRMTMRCLWVQRGSILGDRVVNWEYALVASIIHRTIDAWSIFLKVRSIPRFSIVSVVSRMPAVSMKRNVVPVILTVSSMTSRVVPWMSLTIALSSPTRALSNVDFPAFVSPIIATGIPFF